MPRACQLHDGGRTWKRYHHALFEDLNPDPDGIIPLADRSTTPLPPCLPPLTRQAVVRDNNLDVCRTKQEIKAHYRRFPTSD